MSSLLSCPEEEEEYTSESEEEKRAAEARVQKIHKLQGTRNPRRHFFCYSFLHQSTIYIICEPGELVFQESLLSRDQQICSGLEEKLQVYAELSALSGRPDASPVEPRLLVQPHSEELPQAAVLLAAALQEGEAFCTCRTLHQQTQ